MTELLRGIFNRIINVRRARESDNGLFRGMALSVFTIALSSLVGSPTALAHGVQSQRAVTRNPTRRRGG